MFKDKKILEKVNEINDFLLSDSKKKLEELEEIKKNLSSINFSVKSTAVSYDALGRKILAIKYDIPTIKLVVDENGELSENEMFKAINLLNLISMDDLIKLQDFIQKNVN